MKAPSPVELALRLLAGKRDGVGPMSKDLNVSKALIFRIVHKENIERIIAEGCYSRSAAKGGSSYTDIGNAELILRRADREVPCGPKGVLSDYVPFYFTPFSPMLYNIKTGWGVPKRPMADIIVLVSSLPHLRSLKIPFVFTDRHAYLKAARFSDELKDLNWIIWDALQARDFTKSDSDKFEKYQAEALVHRHVPVSGLLGIVCYDEARKKDVQGQCAKLKVGAKVIAEPKWYL